MPTDAQPNPLVLKLKRRWRQIGLRSLLALVMLAGVSMVCSFSPSSATDYPSQAKSTADSESHHGATTGTKCGGHWPQWRGPNRDNIATDTGLAKQWPNQGPPLRWRVSGLGDGISPVSVAAGRVIALSQYETTEYVRALDERSGQLLWTTILGESPPQPPWMRWLTQRPATMDGERLYAITVEGELSCLQAVDGKELWRKDYRTEFAGERGKFGYSDCPVICDDQLICTPGGPDGSIVSLAKETGEVRWKCTVPDGGRAAYGNGVLVEIAGQRQFVTFLERALVGVSIDDGKLLWRHDGVIDHYSHPHTPLVHDNEILCLNAFGSGVKLLKVERLDGAFAVCEVYSTAMRHIAQYHDHTIRLDDRVYECANGVFSCFEWQSGKGLYQERLARVAAATYADGHFYLHDLRGTAILVDVGENGPVERSRFSVPDPTASQNTTSPVIAGGHLYLREDDRLFCYDIRQDAPMQADDSRPILLPTADLSSLGKGVGAEKPDGRESYISNAIFVPTPQDVVEKMLAIAAVGKDDLVYDLGSGDGRIVIAAARIYGCKAVGLEIDHELVKISQEMNIEAKVEKLVTIREADLFEADFADATVVTLYLNSSLLRRLTPKFEKLRPGTRIVAHQFAIPGYAPDKTAMIESSETGATHTIYLWTAPLKK